MKILFVIRGYFIKNGHKNVTRFFGNNGEWSIIENAKRFNSYDAAQAALDFLLEDGIFQIDKLFVKEPVKADA